MKYKNISLPYPVLGISDDVYPPLEDDCIKMADPIKTATDYKFLISLTQRNKEITQLVKSGEAEYACEVTCKDTFLRQCFHSEKESFEITLPRKAVNGRINFNCFIAAKKDIKQYKNKNFHSDYQGFAFDLEVGDLLAVFPMAYYNTNIKYDKLYAAGSFMQIVEAANGIERTWFNLDHSSGRIMIELPHDLFEKYQRIGNAFPEVIHSSLVHNALVYALSNLEEYAEKGLLWADSLMQRLQETEFQQFDTSNLSDMNVVYQIADMLLQDPYKRLLDSLERISETMKDDLEE